MDEVLITKARARWQRMLRTRCTCETDETDGKVILCGYHLLDGDPNPKVLNHLLYGRSLHDKIIEEEHKEAS